MSDARLHLGRQPTSDTPTDDTFVLKRDRLTTHGVIVGMTGSGKTGLGLVLLEELVAEGVPVIAIDPKGDLASLGLLLDTPDAFAPWVDEDDGGRTAAAWTAGLARDGRSMQDVATLRDRLDLRVLTPGSHTAPTNVLALLDAPRTTGGADHTTDEDHAHMAGHAASALLALAGLPSSPTEPGHVLLAQLLVHNWAAGTTGGLAGLVLQVVTPPFDTLGVFPVDVFMPHAKRLALAMKLNTLLASPGFDAWNAGAPLRVDAMLRAPAGKTPVTVFSLAHLDEGQRAFFTALLLSQIVAHTRQMPGSDALKGVLYFDEVAGYLPPHPKNPASKQPLLTLMKQARAVGFGTVLCTQNPVDLDYKALSNAGVWAVGRLQTTQDRDRVLQGMGAPGLDDVVQDLKKREFVLFDARGDGPTRFKVRHAQCYLHGPMTRPDYRALFAAGLARGSLDGAGSAGSAPREPTRAPATSPGQTRADPRTAVVREAAGATPPAARPTRQMEADAIADVVWRVPAAAAALKTAAPAGAAWWPAVYATVQARFDERDFEHDETLRVLARVDEGGLGPYVSLPLPAAARGDHAPPDAAYAPCPTVLFGPNADKTLKKWLTDAVYRQAAHERLVHAPTRLKSEGGEDKPAFMARVQAALDDKAGAALGKLRNKHARAAARIDAQIDKAQARIEALEGRLAKERADEWMGAGDALLGLFTGSRRRASTLARRAVRDRQQSAAAADKLDRAKRALDALLDKRDDALAAAQADLDALRATQTAAEADITTRVVRLEKADIRITALDVVWAPPAPEG